MDEDESIKRARISKSTFDYGPCPAKSQTQPTEFRTTGTLGKTIFNPEHPSRSGRAKARIITAYEFDPKEWARTNKPWNIITRKFSTSPHKKWSPPSPSDILRTDNDLDVITSAIHSHFRSKNGEPLVGEPLCLGKYCWQYNSPVGGLLCDAGSESSCDHTLKEWMEGCANWDSRIELRDAGEMGTGAFSKFNWPKDSIMGVYLGKLIPRPTENKMYCQQINMGPDFKDESEIAYVDAEYAGTWTRFCNHSCDNNADFVDARVGNTRILALKANRNISKGKEICVDYQAQYFVNLPCLCGKDNCRYPEGSNPPPITSNKKPAVKAPLKKQKKLKRKKGSDDDDGDFKPLITNKRRKGAKRRATIAKTPTDIPESNLPAKEDEKVEAEVEEKSEELGNVLLSG